ncbi:GGDEF domain-containing protein [Vibrio sp. ED004]|uniref:GGDEF domain-containing protein n=1 Tax=unclassified Vibrio TaxID=2614977 RepID=UPI0003701070|nr:MULTISPECIES: GGDEF domain-containing protein [unclassified Vibrio]UPR57195.1 GGDEF domain-containing protein [Vibrio sp. ED004]
MSIEFANNTTIRDLVLKNVSIILALFVLVVAATNFFISHDYILGVMELLISTTFLHVYYKVKNNQTLSWQPFAIAAAVTIGLLYGFAHTKPHSAIVMWVYVLPALYQLLFDRLIGSIATFSMLIATTFIYFPNLFIEGTYPLAFVNFMIPYVMIWVVAYNHETVRIGVQKRLEQLVRTDALTGAWNRLALQQDASYKLHCCAKSHLLHFDLDWFKRINDTYGHSAGDKVLKAIVKEIGRVIPTSKTYRIGGEEFCVIFCTADFQQALEDSEKLRSSIEKLVILNNQSSLNVTISGGLIELPNQCTQYQLDKALQNTDKALYKAKESGRNIILPA